MEENKRSYVWWISIILAAALIWSLIWGVMMKRNVKALENNVNNQYNRAFHEMAGHIDEIETHLLKAQLATDAGQLATIASDIFRETASAKAALGQLPTSEISLDNTSKFLSQAGDYTYMLSQNMIYGGKISDEEYENLAKLSQYSTELNKTITEIEQKLYAGEISFTDKKRGAKTVQAAGGNLAEDLENVEKSFDEYPSLIYDGPFSEHIENQESVMLKNAADIDMNKAQEIASSFTRNHSLEYQGQSQNTAIEAYSFRAEDDNSQLSVAVTKKGGHILYYLKNRNVDGENLSFDDAMKKAEEFLTKNGFFNMMSSYYDKSGGVATLNFAYAQDGVICYSDLVKVRVALDNGEILGLETKGYLMNHTKRNLAAPSITADQAAEKINSRLQITSVKRAVIPKDSLKEVLCYEFKGSFNGRNFIIYINAANGREEKILLLIESETGILTS